MSFVIGCDFEVYQMAHEAWVLRQRDAQLSTDELSASFQFSKPALGLEGLQVVGQDVPHAQLLATIVPQRPDPDLPDELYVRSDDLVAKYPPRRSDLVSHHVYYRPVRAAESAFGVELVLSAQTSLLQSDPRMQVRTTLPGELFVQTPDDGCYRLRKKTEHFEPEPTTPLFFLWRPRRLSAKSLALFGRPGDYFSVTATVEQDDAAVALLVFPESLERGVIRRAAFRCLFVPRQDDHVSARRLFERWAASPPPLAT